MDANWAAIIVGLSLPVGAFLTVVANKLAADKVPEEQEDGESSGTKFAPKNTDAFRRQRATTNARADDIIDNQSRMEKKFGRYLEDINEGVHELRSSVRRLDKKIYELLPPSNPELDQAVKTLLESEKKNDSGS